MSGASKDLWLEVRALEKDAAQLHERAQSLNKQGRYEEAKTLYAEMHRKEDLASRLSSEVKGIQEKPTSEAPFLSRCNRIEPEPRVFSEVEQLSRRGVILGSAVGDAAAMGVQWIYDLTILEDLLAERKSQNALGLEFMDPPRSPFFQYPSGRNSPYGEQLLVLLESLAEEQALNCDRYAELYYQTFGDQFQGYRDVSTKGFLRNYQLGLRPPDCGADDAQANAVARLGPLVAMFAGSSSLMLAVESATRVTQNTEAACCWAQAGAAILEGVLLGKTALGAVEDTVKELRSSGGRLSIRLGPLIADHLQAVLDCRHLPHLEAVAVMGRNCHMPNACQTPLHTVLHVEYRLQQTSSSGPNASQGDHDCQEQADTDMKGPITALSHPVLSPEDGYVQGLRDAMRAGGCCASRCCYAGALLGALLGERAIPAGWRQDYWRCAEVERWAEQICRGQDGHEEQ